MLAIVQILLYGLIACIVFIPLARWFWKRWDRPDKLTRQAIEEHRLTKEEEIQWKERAEELEAIRKEQGKWVRSPKVKAPSEDTKSLALGVLDIDRTGPPGPPKLHHPTADNADIADAAETADASATAETPVQPEPAEPVDDIDLDF